jgi:hypothetical protein
VSDPTQLASDHLFAIGEVAIFWKPGGMNHGKELTILSGMEWRRTVCTLTGDIAEGWRYRCDMPNVTCGPYNSATPVWWVAPEFLRKKRPPRDDLQLMRWDQCPWQPESINV